MNQIFLFKIPGQETEEILTLSYLSTPIIIVLLLIVIILQLNKKTTIPISKIDELSKLNDLKNSGGLTEEEYQEAKARFLN